VRDAVTAS
jgi:chromosome segregation ATPase